MVVLRVIRSKPYLRHYRRGQQLGSEKVVGTPKGIRVENEKTFIMKVILEKLMEKKPNTEFKGCS